MELTRRENTNKQILKGESVMCKYAVVDLEMGIVPHTIRKDKYHI